MLIPSIAAAVASVRSASPLRNRNTFNSQSSRKGNGTIASVPRWANDQNAGVIISVTEARIFAHHRPVIS